MSTVVETRVRARKRHWCEEYADHHRIEPGEEYVRCVAFPDGDINTGDRPWVLKICIKHFEQYGRKAPTRPIPPAETTACDRGPCWKERGHEDPCEPGSRLDPRRQTSVTPPGGAS